MHTRLSFHSVVAWSLTMASYATNLPPEIYAFDLLKCLVGAFIVRSSACTINDIFDRKMDASVGWWLYYLSSKASMYTLAERTKNRPLASGRVSVFAATVYLVIQYIVGIGFFYITLHGVAYALFIHFCPVRNLNFCIQLLGRSLPASSTVSMPRSYSNVKSRYPLL